MPEISLQTVVQAGKDQVSADLAGEAAILNTKTGIYFGLDPVGAQIWQMIQKPCRLEEVSASTPSCMRPHSQPRRSPPATWCTTAGASERRVDEDTFDSAHHRAGRWHRRRLPGPGGPRFPSASGHLA